MVKSPKQKCHQRFLIEKIGEVEIPLFPHYVGKTSLLSLVKSNIFVLEIKMENLLYQCFQPFHLK